jgi:hypothetical protein
VWHACIIVTVQLASTTAFKLNFLMLLLLCVLQWLAGPCVFEE